MIKNWIAVNLLALMAVCWWDVLVMDKSPLVTLFAWIIVCSIVICLIIINSVKNAPESGKDIILNKWASEFDVIRIYYGDSKKKPARNCFYDGFADIPGWYENDACLRKTLLNKIRKL